jgi:alkylation response protein AidB-like acyl-CoA dehydrogenase
LTTLDLTRRQARVDLRGAPGRLVGTAGTAADVLAAARDRSAVLLSAEMIGSAQTCLDMSVEYAKVRSQFGRPIGSFQAVKHRCSDMLLAIESARSAVAEAARAIAQPAVGAPLAVSVAKTYCSESLNFVAEECLHIHGGIGFTWEHDAHLFYRRILASSQFHGNAAHHRDRIADLIA